MDDADKDIQHHCMSRSDLVDIFVIPMNTAADIWCYAGYIQMLWDEPLCHFRRRIDVYLHIISELELRMAQLAR